MAFALSMIGKVHNYRPSLTSAAAATASIGLWRRSAARTGDEKGSQERQRPLPNVGRKQDRAIGTRRTMLLLLLPQVAPLCQ